MRYVLIGNSIAAAGAVSGIRSQDPQGEITILSEENHRAYARPLISYYLEGRTDTDKMLYHPEIFASGAGCSLRLGTRVERIEPQAHCVLLADQSAIPYDRLLVATGSRPFVPPIPGLDTVRNAYRFMTLDDAEALSKGLSSKDTVLILGAGLIGLKCAEGLLHRVKHITVADLADRVLPSVLPSEPASIVQKHLEGMGLEFLLGEAAASFTENTVTFKSGKTLCFDALVLAVGVRPNTELLKEAEGEVNRGIRIDENGKTSLPEIFAAGDCCECMDSTCHQSRILAILPNAYMQGEAAGCAMAGGSKPFSNALPMNAVGFGGLHILSAGQSSGKREYIPIKNGWKEFFLQDDRLIGFILIGETAGAGIYTSLIREQTPLSSLDWELMKQEPRMLAFTEAERRKKLLPE